MKGREGGWERGRERGREGGRERGREGGREGGVMNNGIINDNNIHTFSLYRSYYWMIVFNVLNFFL